MEAVFIEDSVRKLFSLLDITVEHKFNAIRICVYNVDETTWRIFQKNYENDLEECNIADLVNLKCEERNHYKQRLIFQRYWLLCTSCCDIQNARPYDELKCEATRGSFFIYLFFVLNSESIYVIKVENITKYNTLLHSSAPILSYLKLTV